MRKQSEKCVKLNPGIMQDSCPDMSGFVVQRDLSTGTVSQIFPDVDIFLGQPLIPEFYPTVRWKARLRLTKIFPGHARLTDFSARPGPT